MNNLNEKIIALKANKYYEQRGICPSCGKQLPFYTDCDLAHILPRRKWLIVKYGEEIIHHPLNMLLTHHSDNCNSGVQMSPNKTMLVENHVEMIRDAINEKV